MFEPLKIDTFPMEYAIKELMYLYDPASQEYKNSLMILYNLSISEDFGKGVNKKLSDEFKGWYETIVTLGKEKNFSESQLFPSR